MNVYMYLAADYMHSSKQFGRGVNAVLIRWYLRCGGTEKGTVLILCSTLMFYCSLLELMVTGFLGMRILPFLLPEASV